MTAVVGPANVPGSIRLLGAMDRPDYVDTITVPTTGVADHPPEVWARATLEDTPSGRAAPRLWRLLGPRPSPDHVQGWRIAERGDDWIRLEVTSWLMTAHAVVQAADGRVSLALFVRYDRPLAALVWPPVSVFHRRVVPTMLRHAMRSPRLA